MEKIVVSLYFPGKGQENTLLRSASFKGILTVLEYSIKQVLF